MQQIDKRRLWRQLFFTGCLLLLFGGLYGFILSAYRVERGYSQVFFPVFAKIGRFLWRKIPFSVGDVLYFLLLLAFLVAGYLLIRRLFAKQYSRALHLGLNILNGFLCLVLLFYLFWGMNYFRLPLEQRMKLELNALEPCDLVETTVFCIDQANHYKALLARSPVPKERAIFKQAALLMEHNTYLQAYLFPYKPVLKAPLTNAISNYMMVSGYFNPLTQESQMNTAMPWFSQPFTACHELAHQAGIAFEDEANLIGFILCAQSKDTLFRYSAYYNALLLLLSDVYENNPGLYPLLFDLISPSVRSDMKTEYNYWHRFRGPINDAQSLFYEHYLQLNNQPEGLDRYDRMTKLLMAWRKKRL